MGAQRKPTAIHKASGSFLKDPQRGRARSNEPVVTKKIGKPPISLNIEQKNAWKELVDQAPAGVLTYADRINVEMASRLLADMRDNSEDAQEFTGVKYARLQSILASFGMSPADRSRVQVEKKKSENEFGL